MSSIQTHVEFLLHTLNSNNENQIVFFMSKANLDVNEQALQQTAESVSNDRNITLK